VNSELNSCLKINSRN